MFADEELVKWWRTDHCPAGSDGKSCWCEPGRDNKCWERRLKKASDPMDPLSPVMHILKGGEDSIGLLEAVQRVYINIGSCSEPCWTNHLTNFFVIDPTERGYYRDALTSANADASCP